MTTQTDPAAVPDPLSPEAIEALYQQWEAEDPLGARSPLVQPMTHIPPGLPQAIRERANDSPYHKARQLRDLAGIVEAQARARDEQPTAWAYYEGRWAAADRAIALLSPLLDEEPEKWDLRAFTPRPDWDPEEARDMGWAQLVQSAIDTLHGQRRKSLFKLQEMVIKKLARGN